MNQSKSLLSGLGVSLGTLMFVQFFIWGAWYLTVSLYMYENGMGAVRFYAYTAGPLGAIISPFFTGLVADRLLNTERVLGVLFLLAGGFMLLLPVVGDLQGTPLAFQSGENGEQIVTSVEVTFLGMTWIKGELFNWIILLHMICYMPTLGLTASLSFFHLPKGPEQFPLVRLWGTIGWIVSGALVLSLLLQGEKEPVQFWLGGGASVALAVFCFVGLPRTPAPKKGQPVNVRDMIFWDAWSQFRKPSFAVFMIGSFLVCIPLAAYYANLQQQMDAMKMPNIAFMKNLGTIVEALMMFLMPFFFRRLGIKWMIVIGIGAWVLRYALFSWGASENMVSLVIAGIALHGICYDFFFVTGQVYVDRGTPASIRGQAQGMNIFFTQGLGLFIGAIVAGKLAAHAFGDIASHTAPSLPHWPKLWWPLAGLAAVVMVVFAVAFREPKDHETDDPSLEETPPVDAPA